MKKSSKSKKTTSARAKKRRPKKKFSDYALRKIREAGLTAPQENLGTKEFAALQQQWYAKLADKDFKDIEWVDHSTGQGHNSPHLRGSLGLGKQYHPGRALYYDLASNYLQHCKNLRGYRRFMWKLHVEDKTYDDIMLELRKHYKNVPSKYTIYYDIQKIAKLCLKWNASAPEGLIVKRNEDKESILNSYIAEMQATTYNWIVGEEDL